MAHKNFQPETPILEKPIVVGFVDLTKFEKPKVVKPEVKKTINEKKPEPKFLMNADPLHQTIGSIINKHYGWVSITPDGSIKTSK